MFSFIHLLHTSLTDKIIISELGNLLLLQIVERDRNISTII